MREYLKIVIDETEFIRASLLKNFQLILEKGKKETKVKKINLMFCLQNHS